MTVAICPIFVSLFLYADDILLIAPSVSALQTLLNVCEEELKLLDMQLNIQKNMCIRFGARFRVRCKSLASSFGGVVDWNSSCKYLGVYFVSGRTFKCCFDHAKSQFFRSFIHCFRRGSDQFESRCLSVLLYGTDAFILVRDKRSVEFIVSRSIMKLFRTNSANIVDDCQFFVISYQLDI